MKDSKTVLLGYEKSSERGDINFLDTSEPKITDFYFNKFVGGIGGIGVFQNGRYVLVADKKGYFSNVDMFKGPNIEDIKDKTFKTPHEGMLCMSLSPSETKAVCGMSDKKCIVVDLQKSKK